MLLCYITDRTQFSGDESTRRELLLTKIEEAARCGVNYIQLREKDLTASELESLATAALQRIRTHNTATAFLINSRADVAIAAGACGAHLRSDDLSPTEIRHIWGQSRNQWGVVAHACGMPVIGVSCHTAAEVARAAAQQATFAVVGPVFEKSVSSRIPPTGLPGLREASRNKIPVLALGGVTLANVRSCMESGAAGIAAIRLFQGNDIAGIVSRLP